MKMHINDPDLMPDVMDVSPRWDRNTISPQFRVAIQQWYKLQEHYMEVGANKPFRPPFPSVGFMEWLADQISIKSLSSTVALSKTHFDCERRNESIFIDPYVKYMTEKTDCPPQFHPLVATVAVSACLNRDMVVMFDQADFFPNVLGLIVSRSGTRKSTAMNQLTGMNGVRLLPEEVNILPYDMTPEKLIPLLKDHPHSLLLNDEFGHFLVRVSGKRQSYMTGILQILTKISDCPTEYTRSLQKGTVKVEKPYLTMLVGLTPEVLVSTTSLLDIQQGFLPRLLIVVASPTDMPVRPLKLLDESSCKVLENLKSSLRSIYDKYKSFSFKSSPFSEDALHMLNNYHEKVLKRMKSDSPEMLPFYQRWAYQIVKLAIIRMADHLGNIVTKEDVEWAIKEYEKYCDGARKVVSMFITEEVSDRHTQRMKRIRDYIVSECKRHGRISRTEVLRKFNIHADELSKIIDTLEKEGTIEKEIYPNQRGKQTVFLRLSDSKEQIRREA